MQAFGVCEYPHDHHMWKKSLSCLKNSFCQNCGTILWYVRLYAFGVHVFMLVCVYIIVKICLYRSIL